MHHNGGLDPRGFPTMVDRKPIHKESSDATREAAGEPHPAWGNGRDEHRDRRLLAGIAVLLLALLLAISIGHRIARAITALVGYAEVVGRGESIDRRETGISETDAVVQSLSKASEHLRQNARQGHPAKPHGYRAGGRAQTR